MSEIWKPIPTYSRYEASSRGRVRSVESLRILAENEQAPNKSTVHIIDDKGRKKQVSVKRIICATFNGLPPDPTYWANYRKGRENVPDNIYWAPPLQVRHRNAGNVPVTFVEE